MAEETCSTNWQDTTATRYCESNASAGLRAASTTSTFLPRSMKGKLLGIVLLSIARLTACAVPVDLPSQHYTSPTRGEGENAPFPHEFKKFQTLLGPYIQQVSSQRCRDELTIFVQGLGNASLWAVQMLDASAKVPVGLIVGNTYHLGHYDECVEVQTHHVVGKYCLADITFAPTPQKYPQYYSGQVDNPFSLYYDPYKPVWDKFKKTDDPTKKIRDTIHMGVCLPSGCTTQDAQQLVSNIVNEVGAALGYRTQTQVPAHGCSVAHPKPFTTGSWTIIYILTFFFISVVICTTWDLTRNRNALELSKFGMLMESFSIHKNMGILSLPNSSQETNVFNGMKFYSVALIMLGHRCVHSYGSPFLNPQFLEGRYRKIQDMFLLNGSLIVDTFFLIGGYLTCLGLLKEAQKGQQISPIQVYLFRWLKITPMYMLVVFFYGHLLEHMGSGPIWDMKVGSEARRCRDNWWTNLLYINNYVNNKEMCMFQSWYLSCDMHFILLAPMIGTLLAKKPRKGVIYLAAVISAATIIPFAQTLIGKYDGVLRVHPDVFEGLLENITFADVYIKSHTRAAPYFIGMAAAYIFTRLKAREYQFKMWMVWAGSLISTLTSLWSIWGAWYFYIPGREYSAIENALYSAAHRLTWGVAMAWIAVVGGRQGFGIIQGILSKPAMAPLSRLSFGAFLVHGAVQLYFTSSMRIPEYIFFPKLFWLAAGDLVFSFFFALLLNMFFEAPMQGIITFILVPKKKNTGISKEKAN